MPIKKNTNLDQKDLPQGTALVPQGAEISTINIQCVELGQVLHIISSTRQALAQRYRTALTITTRELYALLNGLEYDVKKLITYNVKQTQKDPPIE